MYIQDVNIYKIVQCNFCL